MCGDPNSAKEHYHHRGKKITRRTFVEKMGKAGISVASAASILKAIEPEVEAGRLPEEALHSQERHSHQPEPTRQQPQIEEEGNRITAGEKSAFWNWLESEQIPIHTGISIDNVMNVKLAPWKRLGVMGAAIYLNGDGGQMVGYVWEMAPGQRTAPEKHLYEKHLFVLSGRGETKVWYDKKKVTATWKTGTLFSVPLNTWHEHVNTGDEPVRMIGLTNAPLMIDIFRNLDFIFRNDFKFTDRFNSQPDYYKPEPSKTEPPQGHRHAYSIVNIVPDVYSAPLFPAGHGRHAERIGTVDRHFLMADDTLDAHIEEYQPGVYERAHRHGAGDNVLILKGRGYSLMWPATVGSRPFADGFADKVVRVEWRPMTLFVPPLGWFHQHFNTGDTPVRFVKLDGWENRVYPLTSKQTFNQTSISIEYKDEDSKIRVIYESELSKSGVQMRMPLVEELKEDKR